MTPTMRRIGFALTAAVGLVALWLVAVAVAVAVYLLGI